MRSALLASMVEIGLASMGDFAGKVCYITGGTSGFGEFVAIEAAKEGCKVSFTGRRAERGAEVTKKIQDNGGQALFTVCDVAEEACVEDSIRRTLEWGGSLDYALNNAGGVAPGDRGAPHEMSASDFQTVLDSNVKGAFLSLKHETIAMLAHNISGSIVNVGSIYSIRAQIRSAAYVASKHALSGLTKTFGFAYAKDGLRVNNLAPTYFRTPLTEAMFLAEDSSATLSTWQPGGRPCELDELWGPLKFLWSDASSFYNGQNLVIDGGLTAGFVPPTYMTDGYNRIAEALAAKNDEL